MTQPALEDAESLFQAQQLSRPKMSRARPTMRQPAPEDAESLFQAKQLSRPKTSRARATKGQIAPEDAESPLQDPENAPEDVAKGSPSEIRAHLLTKPLLLHLFHPMAQIARVLLEFALYFRETLQQ